MRERADRDLRAVADLVELPRPGDPVRVLVVGPAPALVVLLEPRRWRRPHDVAEQRGEPGHRADRDVAGDPAGRQLTALVAQPRHEPVAVDPDAERVGPRRGVLGARGGDEVGQAGRRRRRRAGLADHEQAVDRVRHRPPRAAQLGERGGLRRPVVRGERGRRCDEQAAGDQLGQPGRVDPDQVRAVGAGAQDLADHLTAARERHQRRVDHDLALGHDRVEQLGLLLAEGVEEPDRRRPRRLAARRGARDQRDHRPCAMVADGDGSRVAPCGPGQWRGHDITTAMRSMTGYGRGVVERGEVRATVDVRTVNHRFLDLKLRGGPIPAAVEDAIAARVRSAVERGAVTISVHLAGGTPGGMRIDTQAAARVHRVLADLAARLAIPGPDLALVLAQPGVVIAGDPLDDAGAAVALDAVDAALVQLDAMRTAEGAALAAELRLRLDELVAIRAHIALFAAAVPQHVARRQLERVRRLSEDAGIDAGIDPNRLAQEVALLADRADVTEELVRLVSHLDQARGLLDAAGAVGRRLDFLVQEIGRELNTIGSKSALAELTAAVVDAKAMLEKVREQVQNVE